MRKYFLAVGMGILFAGPLLSSGAGLVPCDGPIQGAIDCNFTAFFYMVNTFIRYAIFIAFPITACIFAYAGWLLITDQGSAKNISKAWELIKDAGTGFAIMLLGWVAVKFILDKLLDPSYKPVLDSLFKNSGN